MRKAGSTAVSWPSACGTGDINQDIHRIREDFQRLALFEDAVAIVEDQRERRRSSSGVER